MIKAISRQILEITDTGSAYFEKAWLMVSPAHTSIDGDILSAEAESYLGGLDAPSSIKSSRRILLRTARFLASAAAGGLVTALFIQLY